MANQFDRRRTFVRGLGTLEVRETDPSAAAAFSKVGFIEGMTITDLYDQEDIFNDAGHFINRLTRQQKVTGEGMLLQTSKDEIDLIRNAGAKLYVVRYSGFAGQNFWQMFSFEECRLSPSWSMPFNVGKRTLPMAFGSLWKEEDLPVYYLVETKDAIHLANLGLWADARLGIAVATNRLADISGFLRHGTITSDFATIWQSPGTTPPYFLRLDGANDAVDFGNVLSMNGTDDFLVEVWVRIQGADASNQEILSKKASVGAADGYSFERLTSNVVRFQLADGASSANVDSAATLLQNVWKHVAVAVDRNGNAQMYFNGIATGSAVAVGGIADSSSGDTLYLGRLGAAFGQVDIGGFRVYNFGSGGLPSDIAAIIARHFAAEQSYYGL